MRKIKLINISNLKKLEVIVVLINLNKQIWIHQIHFFDNSEIVYLLQNKILNRFFLF